LVIVLCVAGGVFLAIKEGPALARELKLARM
jgi:hypothetical protein